ncbi:hypothetical protein X777_16348 [Ooceraea biroi]|uniref:Uncharacterized protein n=1 Tax=Ooceraea biroi TaxID=2015173 RepID=A0A026VWS8_OOCBI|nr:hypothetical protein X777_16348 [Ooceraea biroi]
MHFPNIYYAFQVLVTYRGYGNTRNLKCTAVSKPIDLSTVRVDELHTKNDSTT